MKPTKSIKNQKFEKKRLKGLCFWCDEKFVLGYRCQNKSLYSLSVVEEDEGFAEDKVSKKGFKAK